MFKSFSPSQFFLQSIWLISCLFGKCTVVCVNRQTSAEYGKPNVLLSWWDLTDCALHSPFYAILERLRSILVWFKWLQSQTFAWLFCFVLCDYSQMFAWLFCFDLCYYSHRRLRDSFALIYVTTVTDVCVSLLLWFMWLQSQTFVRLLLLLQGEYPPGWIPITRQFYYFNCFISYFVVLLGGVFPW